jgi:hypothetical protein
VIVNEETDETTGKVDFEVYEGVGWKHPQGTQLLCIPLTEHVTKDGALYNCYVRTVPDERECYQICFLQRLHFAVSAGNELRKRHHVLHE